MFRSHISYFLVSLLVLPLTVAAADEGSPDEIRSILAERIDKYEKSVGIAVGLIDEQGSLVVGYGKLSKTDDREPDGKTVFEIGSISKVFTATLLAEMVWRKEVGLDDPVQKFLPESVRVPVRDGTVMTLYHLATHTSGLPRMPDNFAPADPRNPYADYTVEQMYEFLSRVALTGKPGARAAYSNYGVGFLGHILALHAGSDYETLVRQRITGPLKMTDTVITLTPELEKRLAQGYDASLEPVPNWDIPTLAGAGALRSTVDDMLLFLAANLGLTESPLFEAMEDCQLPREELGPEMHIGLGWILRQGHGRTIHWHNGGTGGYHSFVGFDKERKKGVVVLSNSTNDIDDIGFHLLVPAFELAALVLPKTSTDLPASPAGKALAAWLEVTRGSDPDAARKHYDEAFAESFQAAVPVDAYMGMRGQLQGLLAAAVLNRVDVRSDYDLSAYVHSNGVWLAIHIQVRPEEPHKIIGLRVQPTEPPKDTEPNGKE